MNRNVRYNITNQLQVMSLWPISQFIYFMSKKEKMSAITFQKIAN